MVDCRFGWLLPDFRRSAVQPPGNRICLLVTATFVVVGASSGIGAALYRQLAVDGHRVVGLDSKPIGNCDIFCDLEVPQSIVEAAEAIDGPIGGIAHVADISRTAPPAAVIAVNLLGPRHLTELLGPQLRENGGIVLVSSASADRCTLDDSAKDWLLSLPDRELRAELPPFVGASIYETSKSLLGRWALHQVAAFAQRRIRVNCITPEPVETAVPADFGRMMRDGGITAIEALTGRHGRPEQIAQAAAFLLSTGASWVNGADLRVDGGYQALRALAGRG